MYESVKGLSESAVRASKKAVSKAKSNDVSVTYLSGSNLIRESSNGVCKTIGHIQKSNNVLSQKRFKII